MKWARILSSVLVAITLLVSGIAGTASAGTISGLYNTGVDNAGVPLPNATLGDLHYNLTSVPLGSSSNTIIRTAAGGFPFPIWVADNATSAWIGPANSSFSGGLDAVGPSGLYVYQTTFNVTGSPAGLKIVGQWATDDPGIDILINGKSIPFVSPLTSAWTPFSITSGFVTGLNTLEFIVQNVPQDSHTGLRVEMESVATPEPASMTLLGFGIAGLAGYGWRRRKRVVAA